MEETTKTCVSCGGPVTGEADKCEGCAPAEPSTSEGGAQTTEPAAEEPTSGDEGGGESAPAAEETTAGPTTGSEDQG